MTDAATNWGPGLAVLAAGLVLGIFLFFRMRSSGERTSADRSATRKDLQRELDALIGELRELDDTAAKLTEEQRLQERHRLERAAAIVLRALDELPEGLPQTAQVETVATVDPQTRAMRRMVWFTTATIAAAVVYILLLQFSAPRDAGMPVTGEASAMPVTETADPQIAALQQRVSAEPENLDAHIDLARAYFERRDLMGVNRETEYVLQRSPDNARALSYQSLVRLSMGDTASALQAAKHAVQSDPNLLEAWTHLSIVYYQMGDRKAAMNAIDVAIKRHPEEADSLRSLREEMEKAANANAQSADATNPHAQSGEEATAAPAAQAPVAFAGSVTLGAGKQPSPNGFVFVMLRPAGMSAGPPLAAKRLPATAFPIAFAFTDADSMRGEPLPKTARIDARIDSDGDAMTRDAADPIGFVDNVASGNQKIAITLR